MKFNSSYCPAVSKSEPQCPIEVNDYLFNKQTNKLEIVKKIPFYKEIQSHYDSTKLSTKLTAYSMGDFTALGFEHGSYTDISGKESNLANVLNTNQIAKTEFERLPSELKQLFNSDFTEFIKCIDNNTLEARITSYIKDRTNGQPNGQPNGQSNGQPNS